MKLFSALLLTLGLVWSAFAQPAAPPPAGKDDAIAREMQDLEKQDVQLKLQERRLHLASRAKDLEHRKQQLDGNGPMDGNRGQAGFRQYRMKNLPPRLLHLMPFFILAKIMAVLFFFCMVLHILLTIVVFKDMRQAGDVNGLWIVVVLMGGLLAVIAYALLKRRA
jgi:hypothetical protein